MIATAEKLQSILNRHFMLIAILALLPLMAKAGEGLKPAVQKISNNKQITHRRISVDEICHEISKKLSHVLLSDCLGNGLVASGGVSVKGYPILIKEYPPLPNVKPLGRVLLIGGIHGDEYSAVSIVFKWINKLDKYHSGMFHWEVAPLVNPDGLLRKKSQRMNEHGVDLNRNFPTPDWKEKSNYYWVKMTRRNPRRYPGPTPLSEPESRWLAAYIKEFKPDVIVSVHAPYGILDFDGPSRPPKKLGYLYLNLLGTYPGSLGNYAGIQKSIPVVTIELPYAGIMPTESQISGVWADLIKWLRHDAKQPDILTPTQQVQKTNSKGNGAS